MDDVPRTYVMVGDAVLHLWVLRGSLEGWVFLLEVGVHDLVAQNGARECTTEQVLLL